MQLFEETGGYIFLMISLIYFFSLYFLDQLQFSLFL